MKIIAVKFGYLLSENNDYYLTYIVNDCLLKAATCDNAHFKHLCNEIHLGNVNFDGNTNTKSY